MQLRFLLFLLLFSILSCNKKGDADIYGIVINKTVKSLPPPLFKEGGVISQKTIDSLDKVRINIVVYPFKYGIKNRKFTNIKNALHTEIDYFQSSITVKDDDLMKIRNSISYKIIDVNQLNNIDFKKIDGIIYLSEIIFNTKKTEAFLIISFTRNKLSSQTILYLLSKQNKSWEIKEKKLISVS